MKLMACDAHPAGQVFDEQVRTRLRVGSPKDDNTKPSSAIVDETAIRLRRTWASVRNIYTNVKSTEN